MREWPGKNDALYYISKAGDSATTRSRRSHNSETTRALYSQLDEGLDSFFHAQML